MDIKDVTSLAELEEVLKGQNGTEEEDTLSSQGSNDEPLGTDPPQEEDKPSSDPIRDAILALTPEQVLAMHPGVAGKVGALGQKLAREQVAQELENRKRADLTRQEQEEEDALLTLAESNPEAAGRAFAERTRKERDQKESSSARKQYEEEYGRDLASEIEQIYSTPIMSELADSMTDDQLVSMYWKNGQYKGFADWTEGMIKTVREFGREEGRREAAAGEPKSESRRPNPATRRASQPAFSANLDTEAEESGQFVKGSIDKMDWKDYAANRDAILKSIPRE